MRRLFGIQKREDDYEAVEKIDHAIRARFPDVTPAQARNLRNKVLNYVGDGMHDGYDLAMIKRQGDQTVLRVLKMVVENDD